MQLLLDNRNMSAITAQKPVQLRYNDASNVVVHPENEDRTVISSADAVLSILGWGSITTQIAVLQQQLQNLLCRLQMWCDARSDRLHRADIQVGGDYTRVKFVVMQKDIPHDDELSEMLSEFDIDIFNDPQFSEVRMDVLCIPRCSIDAMQAFVNLNRSICIAEYPDA